MQQQEQKTQLYATNSEHIVHSIISDVEETPSQNILLFPNPTTGIIKLTGGYVKEVKVFNTLGVLVKSITLNAKEDTEINLSDLPNGIYLLQMQNDHQNITKHVVKIMENAYLCDE